MNHFNLQSRSSVAFCLILVIGLGFSSCEEETCTDGILNQDETEVDCGGGCSPCPVDCVDSAGSDDINTCIDAWSDTYLEAYFDTLEVMSDTFSDDVTFNEVQNAHGYATSTISSWCCCSDTSALIDLDAIVAQRQFDTTLSQSERDYYIALNNWLGLVSPNAVPGNVTMSTIICQ